MDIQQTDKESLATYVHRFKWEANRCKFDNDAATIQIFLKGLKNAHTIATKVYEKGPQTLTEAIKEVEKLQAAQQITSTLLTTSLVNTMSSNNDRCFQCQEVGHMACYCPQIRCYDCNNYGHVVMDCPDKILPSGTPSHHRPNNRDRNRRSSSRQPVTPDVCATTTGTGPGSAAPDPVLIITVIKAVAIMSTTRTAQDPPIYIPIAALHVIEAPAHITIAGTLPTPNLLAATPPGTTAEPGITPNTTTTNQPEDHHQQHKHHLENTKTRDRKPKQVSIDDPLSDYYSSEESESNSEDDLN